MVNTVLIETPLDADFDKFETLYLSSFPRFEQRDRAQQLAAFSCNAYRLMLYFDDSVFVGFVASWQLSQVVYVEHFAVDTQLRGMGYGQLILNQFVEQEHRTVVLEIDPVVDEVSAARLRFYVKCGFFENDFAHTHPPYCLGAKEHSLVVLSSGGVISYDQYAAFDDELRSVVMRGC